MKKRLNINKSICFYLVLAGALVAILQLVHAKRVAEPIQEVPAKYTPVKEVPADMRAQFSEDAVAMYEEAAVAGMAIDEFVQDQLAQQEQVIWQEIETYTGMPHEELVELKDDIKQYHLGPDKFSPTISEKLSEESLELARQAMIDFDLDPAEIAFDTGNNTLMQGSVLRINQKEHLSVPPMAAKAIIGHEMMHYKLDDCFFLAGVQAVLKEQGETVSKCGYKHPYYKLRRFQEMRADIIPALKNLEYARASVQCLEIMLNQSGDGGHISHPKTTYRLKEIRRIYKAMQLEQLLNV